jgi:hypothetical protein
MARDGRPKESKYKPSAGNGADPIKLCSACGSAFLPVYKADATIDHAASPKYSAHEDGTFTCQDKRACRARQLAKTLAKELSQDCSPDWLFVRFPRDLLKQGMEPRPADWKAKGWLPRIPHLEDRLLAGILYCSWCYPVSLTYAVQLAGICPLAGREDDDPDELLVDRYKQFIPLREIDLVKYYNERQPNVNRALHRLVARRQLRIDDDGILSPAARLAEMSIDERQMLYLGNDPGLYLQLFDASQSEEEQAERRALAKILRTVPQPVRADMIRIHEAPEVPEDIRSTSFQGVEDTSARYNKAVQDLKAERSRGYEDALKPALNLIPQSSKSKTTAAAPVPSPASTPPPKAERSLAAPAGTSDEELYALGLGKGALAKLPALEDRPGLVIAAHIRTLGFVCDDDAGHKLWGDCRERAADVTVPEICGMLAMTARKTATMKSPVGFLLYRVPQLCGGGGLAQVREILAAAERASPRFGEIGRERAADEERRHAQSQLCIDVRAKMTPQEWDTRVAVERDLRRNDKEFQRRRLGMPPGEIRRELELCAGRALFEELAAHPDLADPEKRRLLASRRVEDIERELGISDTAGA